MKVTHKRNIFYETNYFNCKRKSIMQMSNMSGVDVRGFGNKLFTCTFKNKADLNQL